MDANGKIYGLVAEFDSPAAILCAAEKVRDAGYHRWDAFTPFPIHGMEIGRASCRERVYDDV